MTTHPIDPQPSCVDEEEFGSLSFEEARRRILDDVQPLTGSENLPLQEGVGRILHLPIVSATDVPPHTNSAVDGFAVRASDLPPPGKSAKLKIVGTALAGKPYRHRVLKGEAVRIMTGAPMPPSGDTVLMQEHVDAREGSLYLDSRHTPGQNVRCAGEDIRANQTVLSEGRRLTPADIGLVASLGIGEVVVKRRLSVSLSSTGDEIRALGHALPTGCLYDSNRYTLGAAIKSIGADLLDLGIIGDDESLLKRQLTEAANISDVVITSGGVSVGDADYTKSALKTTGTVQFWKVAIKPGRPIAFGRVGKAVFFGLPGNPVAVMVTFYQLVLPALEKIMGLKDKPQAPMIVARCLEPIRKKPGRTEFQRGVLERTASGEWQVRTTGKQGSGILRSMSLANAFIVLPHERGPVEAGDLVTVQPFAGLI